VKGALDRGGRDNATALVVEIGERRVKRGTSDGGFAARDAAFAAQCPLFSGIADSFVSRALAAAVEVRFKPDESIPRFLTEDRVGYILLQGNVTTPQGWTLGPSSLVYPESLVGGGRGPLCKARDEVRALRIRADDLREVCSSDKALAAAIYESLARSLVRTWV
jgi:CRP-like cAMP-binding protein